MESQPTPRTPACVNCSRRKTKCDRNNPCSSCKNANLSCIYTAKKAEKKHRISLSARYETSLSDISNQLDELSGTLNDLVEKVEALSASDGAAFSTRDIHHELILRSARDQTHSGANTRAADLIVSNEYPTSSKSQSITAVDHSSTSPEDAIGIVETLTADSKVQESLTQEDTLIQTTSSSFSQYPELSTLSLPPMEVVLRLLALTKISKQQYFVEFPHMSQAIFAELCQKVYFPTQLFTIFAWLSVNCGLFYLFRDLDSTAGFTTKEISDGMSTCNRNVDAAVRCLRLSVTSTFEAAQALLHGAFVVMDGERGSVAWTLLSTAARMSIDLGLHRLPPGKEKYRERMLFWHIYALERSLAFTFGRSATIQDHDVTTELPSTEEDYLSEWGFTFLKYIDFARLQYETHVKLLSAGAQRESNEVRTKRAHDMADRLRQDEADLMRQRPNQDHTTIVVGIASMLTVVYRTIPPEDLASDHPLRFHPLCVEAGRTTLKSLLHIWQMTLQQTGGVAKLPLLFVPYLPYVALFGNQVSTGDQEDLQLMRNIVDILQTVSETTVATRKMYNGFLRLLKIAEVWPRAHAPSVNGGSSVFGDIDMTEINWQDMGLSDLTWNQTFNDFDFGPGSEAIRDMMPWFDQQFGESSAGG